MIRRYTVLCLCCSLFVTNILSAQAASEELSYLQKHIRIWVLLQPNAEKPEFYPVQPTGVFLDTDGIIMGKSSNNGMTNSAKLLSALFKDPAKRSNGGDQMLQTLVYHMLKAVEKPIDIYFINDKLNNIEDKYADSLHIYVSELEKNKNKVFAGTYAAGDKNDSSAGRIVVGETATLEKAKDNLIRGVSFLYLKKYHFLSSTGVYNYENPSPPPLMYTQKKLNATRQPVDIRTGIYNAVSLTFLMEARIYKSREKEYYDSWLATGPYIQVRINDYDIVMKHAALRSTPEKYILNNQIKRSLTYPSDTGFFLTDPPFKDDADIRRVWKIYNLKNLDNYNKLRNEFILALILKKYMDHHFAIPFIESLILKDRRLEKAAPEKQFPFLIENLCMYGIGEGETIGDSVDKIYFFPLALMDLFLDFPIEIVDNNFHSARTFFGVFSENSFSPELLKAYFKLRPAIKEAATKANKKAGTPPLYSGYDNITKMCDGIWEYLYNNR
ncbi:MAG: hypothetical protein SGI96_20755 [Bacteroidota bacterium]|nr:hypothetical protein [Bacteroidota bacterium]